MTRRPSNVNYHQTVKDRPTGGRFGATNECHRKCPTILGGLSANRKLDLADYFTSRR